MTSAYTLTAYGRTAIRTLHGWHIPLPARPRSIWRRDPLGLRHKVGETRPLVDYLTADSRDEALRILAWLA